MYSRFGGLLICCVAIAFVAQLQEVAVVVVLQNSRQGAGGCGHGVLREVGIGTDIGADFGACGVFETFVAAPAARREGYSFMAILV